SGSGPACSRAPGTGPSAGPRGRAEKLISSSSSSCLTGPSLPRYPSGRQQIPPPTPREASMGARRYGDGRPVAMDAYHQSKHELDGLPNTVTEKIPVTNTPNIFSYRSYVFAKNPALVRRFIKATKAAELGLYGPGQDLVADAFTGNLRGAGPATVALPFPVRKDNPSQTVLVSFADKTEPMAFNHYATGAYMLPRFNTGLIIAAS